MEESNENLTKRQRRMLKKKEKVEHKLAEEKKKKMSRIGMFVVLTLVFVGIIWGAMQLSGDGSNVTVDAVNANDQVLGNTSATVTLIEYSDFQCPACRSAYNTLNEVKDEFTNTVQIVYRHFPLRNIHSNAQLAGQAAEAAGQQGMFWEMHDELFDNQSDWSEAGEPLEKFATYAEELGLDADQFRTDIESDIVRNKVNDDYNSGVGANVKGTPSFFLNGEKVDTPRDADAFRTLLQDAVTEAGGASVEVETTADELPVATEEDVMDSEGTEDAAAEEPEDVTEVVDETATE